MTPDEIDRLSRAAQRAGVTHLELMQASGVLRLSIANECAQALQAGSPTKPLPEATMTGHAVAPSLGIFHHRHPLTGRPAHDVGHRVGKGQVLGFILVEACVLPVTAPCDGFVGEPLLEDGAVVGYGTPLYPMS